LGQLVQRGGAIPRQLFSWVTGRLASSVIGLFAVAVMSLVTLLLACVLVFPKWIVGRDADPLAQGPIKTAEALKAKNDVRTTLLQGLGTLVAIASVIVTLRVNNERGQTTERFVKAVDQLGSNKLEARLGGIYALEQVAKGSTAERPMILEILSGFVRGHSPWPPTSAQRSSEVPLRDLPLLGVRAADVQAVMTTLGRLPKTELQGSRLNLVHVDLRRADLPGAHLRPVYLEGAHLEGANLRSANLQGANLSDANLKEAILIDANLEGANLHRANLEAAILRRTNLQNALLTNCLLIGAQLYQANLQGASLSGANLQGAILSEANLQGASLSEANLQGAILSGAIADSRTTWPEGFDWRG
jgi:uncharacterized protein YjbI with pentapeptide repeats